jgi:hypothetical protein
MQRHVGNLFIVIFIVGFGWCATPAALADVCAICGKPITGQAYIVTDQVTGEREIICSDCAKLPRCYVCGLPIKKGDELELPDGRYLCARDAKTVVLKTDEAEQICAGVKDDLDRLFARFTSFPANVEVTAIDHIDAYTIFQSESPGLLGCTQPLTDGDGKRHYKISLMTGLPLAELKETCAHEYSHTWVGENVSRAQRGLGHDAEEGFCEMVGYLYMDSLNDEAEKKRVMANLYTRGQVALFVEAEKRYGFDQVLDWMKYGTTAQLESGHLEALRDIKVPASVPVIATPVAISGVKKPLPSAPGPATLKLQGIFLGAIPTAIINGIPFGVNDVNQVKIAGTNVTVRCLAIQKDFVRIRNMDAGKEQELRLPPQ